MTTCIQAKLFLVDGPGGTGKTFLHDLLLADVRSHGDVAGLFRTCCIILTGGRTAHSRFSIPIPPEGNNCCK